MAGAVLTLGLLPVEAWFWFGFDLPIPKAIGVARIVLLAIGWSALVEPVPVSVGRKDPCCRGVMHGIFHVDMDEFIAAVEVLRRPELRGKPVVVGGDGLIPRSAAWLPPRTYEARAFGIGSAMPLRTAYKRNPDAVFLAVDAPAYLEGVDARDGRAPVVPRVWSRCWGWDEAFMAVSAASSIPRCSRATCRRLCWSGPSCGAARTASATPQLREVGKRVRQTSKGEFVSPDARELGRGHGRPAHRRAVGYLERISARSLPTSGCGRCRSSRRSTNPRWRRRSARRRVRGCVSSRPARAVRR